QARCPLRGIAETELFGFCGRGILAGLHTEFQVRRGAENTLCLSGVLNTGKLNDNSVGTLALNQRLCDAQLVHPVANRCQVLLQSVFLNAAKLCFRKRQGEQKFAAVGAFIQQKLIELVANQFKRLSTTLGVPKTQNDFPTVLNIATAVANPLVTHILFDLRRKCLESLAERRLHVNFQQEVNTTTKVQAEFHWPGTQATQPARCSWSHIQRNKIVITQGRLDSRACPQLVVRAGQTNQCISLFYSAGLDFNTLTFESAQRTIQNSLVYLGAATSTGDLNRVIVREKIR